MPRRAFSLTLLSLLVFAGGGAARATTGDKDSEKDLKRAESVLWQLRRLEEVSATADPNSLVRAARNLYPELFSKVSALREMLRRSGVLLYAVRVTGGGDVSRVVPTELQGLAQTTGGRVFNADSPAAIGNAFERIGLDLHNLYTLGFKSNAADGKWHKLKLKVQPPPKWPHMNARAREGFYADAPASSN